MITTTNTDEMVDICHRLAEKGTNFTAEQKGGVWEIKINGV